MSEKRFKVDYGIGVLDTKTNEIICDTVNAEEVVELLNEQQATIQFLQNEIDELKKDIDIYKYEEEKHSEYARKLFDKIDEQQDIIEAKDSLLSVLSKENEQLRQKHQRLYNYFRDYLEDEMSAENFGEMWDNVKEDERWNDG